MIPPSDPNRFYELWPKRAKSALEPVGLAMDRPLLYEMQEMPLSARFFRARGMR